MNKIKNKLIILVALEEELPKSMLPELIIEYTGVGKINATYRTLEAIQKYNPEIIINFGTAGAISNVTGLVEVTGYVDRDMDVRALGFKLGQTPFEEGVMIGRRGLVVGSGDSFAIEKPEIECDIVDMEAYAIARVC